MASSAIKGELGVLTPAEDMMSESFEDRLKPAIPSAQSESVAAIRGVRRLRRRWRKAIGEKCGAVKDSNWRVKATVSWQGCAPHRQ